MKQYLNVLREIRERGVRKPNRTGIDTIGLFALPMKFDLSEGFPLMTTKKVPLRLIAEELFWFLQGETNIRPLVLKNVHIWDEWPYQKYARHCKALNQPIPTQSEFIEQIKNNEVFAQQWGDLGPVYGFQWRHWKTIDGTEIDQLGNVIEKIRNNPTDRRLVVSAWNPGELSKMALSPCHYTFQFYVAEGKLSCAMIQRSCDMFLGVPFNIASYALLTHLVAAVTNLQPGELTIMFNDVHIYVNHLEQVDEQLERTPKVLPQLEIQRKVESISDYRYEDLKLIGYDPYPAIKGEVAV